MADSSTPVVTPTSSSSSFTLSPVYLSPPSSLLTIKLTNDNYLLWRAQLLPYLRSQGLFGHVDGSCSAPEVFDEMPHSNSAFLAWQQRDQAIMSLLISSISEPLLAHVLEASTSHEVWTIIDQLFSTSSQARMMQVFLQLTTLKKGSEPIPEYYRRAKLLVDSLAVSGKIIPPSEFIVFLLAGLGSDYDSVVTSITARADSMSPAQVYGLLLTHESRLQHQLTALTDSPSLSANITSKPHPPTYHFNNRGIFRGRSNFRGRGSRFRGGGRHSSNVSNFPSANKPVCQVCNKPGHTAATCYHRFDYNYQPQPPPSLSANFTYTPSPSYNSQPISDLNWYPDTAATHHFTNDFSNLSINPSDYHGPDQVRVGHQNPSDPSPRSH